MAIPEKTIDQIRERTDIVEVISQYIQLKKTGRSFKANCPFHNEKTPSFVVSADKQIYHCFGCGAGGNVFSFLMKYENIEFPEAVEMLAHKAGIAVPHAAGRSDENTALANQLYGINEKANKFFQEQLTGNSAAKEYLASRGISDKAIHDFSIGYAPQGWEMLLNFLSKHGMSATLAEKAGLVVSNEKGGHYDRFRNRITFPIIDLKGRTLGFGARVMDTSLPKYINSPETPIYSKGRHLYGLNLSKDAIRKEGHALIVEGYLDFIIPYQAGVKNIIATLGTALTVDQVKLLKRFAPTVIMLYDPDAAGEAASLRNLDLFISEDVNVYIAELPKGFDPDTYIRKFGADEFEKIVKSARNIFDYKFEKLKARFNITTTHGKASIAGEMMPTIARINNAVARADLVKKLSVRLGVDEDSIKAELKKVKPGQAPQRYLPAVNQAKKHYNSAEMIILALLLDSDQYISRIQQVLTPEELRDCSVRDVVNAVFALSKEKQPVNPARLISYVGNANGAASLVSEASGLLDTILEKDKERALNDCIARIKKDNVSDILGRLQEAIRAAHSQNDEDRVKALVTEYNNLVKAHKV